MLQKIYTKKVLLVAMARRGILKSTYQALHGMK
jgi:hypothetical protein